MMATWRTLLSAEMAGHGDTLDGIVAWACGGKVGGGVDDAAAWLDIQFDDGLGIRVGAPFTAWTEGRVYFPRDYDGEEWVASAPRHPCSEAMGHVGGGG